MSFSVERCWALFAPASDSASNRARIAITSAALRSFSFASIAVSAGSSLTVSSSSRRSRFARPARARLRAGLNAPERAIARVVLVSVQLAFLGRLSRGVQRPLLGKKADNFATETHDRLAQFRVGGAVPVARRGEPTVKHSNLALQRLPVRRQSKNWRQRMINQDWSTPRLRPSTIFAHGHAAEKAIAPRDRAVRTDSRWGSR